MQRQPTQQTQTQHRQQAHKQQRQNCRTLYLDYKNTCAPVEDTVLNPCQDRYFDRLTIDELQNYIQKNILDRQTIFTCREKRFYHNNQCHGGVMDPGHQVHMRILEEFDTKCIQNLEKALQEYRKRLIVLIMNIGNLSNISMAMKVLSDTLYLRGIINGNEQIPQDLSFIQVRQIINELRNQGPQWLIRI